MNGIESMAAERQRQIDVEGWSPAHDDEHNRGELAGAAAAYAIYRSQIAPACIIGQNLIGMTWPFGPGWWKPKDRRGDLVRAGALIAAEIDRIDRLAAKSEKEK